MLKTVAVSSNKKTGPIAVTYRAGVRDTYGTCPKTCQLNPVPEAGTDEIDEEYFTALLNAVPRNGVAWTYSHFPWDQLPVADWNDKNKTVINASCDDMDTAVDAIKAGRPSVVAAPLGTDWSGGHEYRGVNFVRCPAELADNFTCMQCGNGKPLCARPDRDYVIVFVAHGSGAKKVGTDCAGGCYAAQGNVAIQWHDTRKTGAANDAARLLQFAKSLPPGSMLRHHVAGDIGRAA
jgi:hypothetical protein